MQQPEPRFDPHLYLFLGPDLCLLRLRGYITASSRSSVIHRQPDLLPRKMSSASSGAGFASVNPNQQQSSTIPIKLLSFLAFLLIGTMCYNSLSGWQVQSHGQRFAREAALPLQRRIRKSRYKSDDPDSPDEFVVEALVKREGKGMGKGKGKGRRGLGKLTGIAAVLANQPAALEAALRTRNASLAYLRSINKTNASAAFPPMQFKPSLGVVARLGAKIANASAAGRQRAGKGKGKGSGISGGVTGVGGG